MAIEDPLCTRDDGGSRSNAVRLTKSVKAGIILTTLCLLIVVAAGVMNHSRLKSFYERYHLQKKDIAGLKNQLAMRNAQFEKVEGELRALEIRLAELVELEKNIRNIAGVEEFSDRLSLFGVGGEIPETEPEDIYWQDPEFMDSLDGRLDRIDEAVSRRSQSLQALYDILKTQEALLAVTPSTRPVDGGWISSGFGYRKSPFTGRREYHTGIDIAIRPGSRVNGTADGVVIYTGTYGGLGKMVTVDHGFGIITRYCHLNKILVEEQQEIRKGDKIAETGNSGRSTGPHIHYEIRFNDIPMDAEKYMAPYLAENVTE